MDALGAGVVLGTSSGSQDIAAKVINVKDGSMQVSQSPGVWPGSPSSLRDEGKAEGESVNSRQQVKEPKYHLYPKISPQNRSRTAPLPIQKPLEKEKVLVENTEISPSTKRTRSVRHLLSSTSRFRRKDSSASRTKDFRRDASPMTTVTETALDSREISFEQSVGDMLTIIATIPGRYPVHERSYSAPGWGRQGISGDARETGRVSSKESPHTNRMAAWPVIHLSSPVKRKPVSPPKIGKLIITDSETAPWRMRTPSQAEIIKQTQTSAPEPPPKESPVEVSPGKKESGTPTNLSSLSLTSSTAAGTPMTECEHRLGTNPWENHSIGAGSPSAHQRGPSETPTILRGRTVRRRDDDISPRSKSSATSISAVGKANQTLPSGFKSDDAPSHYSEEDMARLREQALGQAMRFEVLGVKDVECLSKELRALDERCEYLRRCQLSLRSNRQTLHSRTITYLQSPRLTHFSREDMLRQELALARLDHALDDYNSKMEQAENRRSRIRQKLLEHVAAALTVNGASSSSTSTNVVMVDPSSKAATTMENTVGVGVGLGVRVGFPGVVVGDHQDHTPPDTPESRPTTPSSKDLPHGGPPPMTMNRRDVESIRIYADSNLCGALFAATTAEVVNPLMIPSRSSSLEHYGHGHTSHDGDDDDDVVVDENEIQIGVEIQEGAFLRLENGP